MQKSCHIGSCRRHGQCMYAPCRAVRTEPPATPLASKMRAKAAEGGPDAAELTRLADEFDAATAGYYGHPQTVDVRRFMGCYARARIAWCKASGEPLV